MTKKPIKKTAKTHTTKPASLGLGGRRILSDQLSPAPADVWDKLAARHEAAAIPPETWRNFPTTPVPSPIRAAETLLTDAAAIVGGSRQQTHGSKERSLRSIAKLWSTFLHIRGVLPSDLNITPNDVAILMVLLKVSRQATGDKNLDHFIDMAGYAGLAGEMSQL